MKATFHGGPLDGQTSGRDDWAEPGTAYSVVQLLPPHRIDDVGRWHVNGPPVAPADGTFYVLDRVEGLSMAHYRWVPKEGEDADG